MYGQSIFEPLLGWIDNPQLLHSGVNSDLVLGCLRSAGGAVVVKCLRDYRNSDARRQFENQVRVLSRRYDGAVPLLAENARAEHPYYVMGYLPGGRLAQYAGSINADRLHAIALRVASILANMHAASDVHGDLKPHNMLLDAAGELWLADPLGNPTLLAGLFAINRGGTPGYWAPEVRDGASISVSADVYSFGATLYHLATGDVPQEGQRIDTLIQQHPIAPWIRLVITLCCNPLPSVRPTMSDVLRLLRGETWASIQAEKMRNQLALFVVILLCAFLVFSPFFGDGGVSKPKSSS